MMSLLTYPAGTLHGLFGSDEMIFHFANDEIKNLYINDICKEKGKMKDESVLLSIIPVYQKWIVTEIKCGMNGTNKIRSCLLSACFNTSRLKWFSEMVVIMLVQENFI